MERFAPGFRDLILARSALGPLELEAHNRNLVGGDINGGAMTLAQALFRPARSLVPVPDRLTGPLSLLGVDAARRRRPRHVRLPRGAPCAGRPRQIMRGVEIVNRDALVERFGDWPSIHDAEVYGVRLDSGQRTDGKVRLQLDVHVFAGDGLLPDGRVNVVNHTLVTLEFEDVEDIELDGFGPQNVLFDLELEEVELASGRQLRVTLPASNGMDASFRCRTLSVLDAVPFEPGEHSVYRR